VRTIIHGDGVDGALELVLEDWPLAGEVWEAITWLISRDPFIGTALTESGNIRAYALDGAVSRGWPTLVVMYIIEPQEVTVTDARYSQPKFAQAGRA
jgi:hypothetical protein